MGASAALRCTKWATIAERLPATWSGTVIFARQSGFGQKNVIGMIEVSVTLS